MFISGLNNSTEANVAADDRGDDNDGMLATEEKKTREPPPLERSLDPPPTWVQPLVLDRQQYLLRYPPSGRRTVLYLRAKVDYFAKNTQAQAIVMRVIFYLDKARTTVKEVHEWFENRKDRMYKRVRHFLEDKVSEYYLPGSTGEVKLWVEYPGKRREIDFYISARLDRLKRREEELGKKITEYYEGRTDRLTFRSVILSTNKADAGARSSYTLPGGGLAPELYVLKMTQAFSQDPNVPSGSDVAKRTFWIGDGRVVSQYHFVAGKITRQTKVYNHSRGGAGLPMTAGPEETSSEEDQEGLQEAAGIERDCYAGVKTTYTQIQQLIKLRSEFEEDVIIERTVFETALERAEKGATGSVGADGGAGVDTKGVDYLTPYLRNVKDPQKITKDEALEVRQACLDALKARLLERANIIQARLNDENVRLARKQEQFQRSQREGDLSTEDYENYCTQAMFRIQILEQRLVAHEEAALKKYSVLDAKLASDPRLRVLRT